MKIAMTTEQAQKVRKLIDSTADPELFTLDQNLATALGRREASPMLTAAELKALAKLLVCFLVSDTVVPEAMDLEALRTSRAKLERLAERQAKIEAGV